MGNKHDQRPAAAIAGISAQLEGLDGWQISAARGVRPDGKFRHGLSVEMAQGGSLVPIAHSSVVIGVQMLSWRKSIHLHIPLITPK